MNVLWNEGERGRREMMAVGDLVKRSFFSFLLKKGGRGKAREALQRLSGRRDVEA